jgi:dCTP deaminase
VGILSGKAILQRLDPTQDRAQRLVIAPWFQDGIQVQKGAGSIDLHLGCRFAVAKQNNITHFESYSDEHQHPSKLVSEKYVPLNGKFVLHPGRLVLATTFEWIRLPANLAGYLVGRSTYGRRGLVIATAAGVHPNYSGVLTLELANLADIPLAVTPGQSVCQLFLHDVPEFDPEGRDKSSFLGSLHPTLGHARPDEVHRFLQTLPG